jgi:SAM-dependent methyltransferase
LLQDQEAAGAHWDRMLAAGLPARVRWWDDPTSIRHINRIVCGEAVDGLHAGFHRLVAASLQGQPPVRAISIGCGTGAKEVHLLVDGSVEHFDCYELSAAAIAVGRQMAVDMGLADRMHFHHTDVFTADLPSDFGLVYWNNALHHMPDVEAAVQWSKARLRPGGLFAMDDYVGPSRFQWTETNIRWANRVRASLPERLLVNPWVTDALVSREVERPTPESVIAADPSEAMDSGRILGAVQRHFPAADIIPTGGCLYHLALSDIFWCFTTEDDALLLDSFLLLDQALAEASHTQYAVAIGRNVGM